MQQHSDCIVVGAGPAGLTAAIYLARFHLSAELIDAGASRAGIIPRTRNHAGYPGGVSGAELLERMRTQAEEFGITVTRAAAERIERADGGFIVHAGEHRLRGATVLLATGVVNRRPPMDPDAHDAAVSRGLLRYCPICDGYEVTDRKVGVIGTGAHGRREAVFLRMYTPDITLISPERSHALDPEDRAELDGHGIAVADGPCGPLRIAGDRIVVPGPSGELSFDSVYPALGSIPQSSLAASLNASTTEDGSLVVDAHKRTSVPGLYAAGDVTSGLDQISHAMGEAGVAATAIRNDLAEQRRLMR